VNHDFPQIGSRNLIFTVNPCKDPESGQPIFILFVIQERDKQINEERNLNTA
jgi:hypothetical protein